MPTMNELRAGYSGALRAMETGTYKEDGDVLDFSLWDRFQIDGTTPTLEHRLFVNGLGSPGGIAAAKNLADTNVQGNGGVPQGQKFYVRAIKIFYESDEIRTPAEIQALYDVLANTTLDIRIPGKDTYGQWGLDELFGITSAAVVVPAATNYNPPTSIGSYRGVLPINLPIVFAANVQYTILVTHHAAPAADLDDDLIKIALQGILERLS